MRLIRRIERATSFKVAYYEDIAHKVISERSFQSLKSLSQWVARNEGDFRFLEITRFALIDDQWEPFTTIGNKTITLDQLNNIVRQLSEDFKPSKIKK